MTRRMLSACIILIFSMAFGSGLAEKASRISDQQAYDIVLAQLQLCYPVDSSIFSKSGYHTVNENWYGALEVSCGYTHDLLDSIAFEIDPFSGEIITSSFIDEQTKIWYTNTMPEDCPVSASEALETAIGWMKERTPAESFHRGMYYDQLPQKHARQEPVWIVTGDTESMDWFRVVISSRTGRILHAFHMKGSFDEHDHISWSLIEEEIGLGEGKAEPYQLLKNGTVIGRVEVYEEQDADGMLPILSLKAFVQAIGGESEPIESDWFFSIAGKMYMINSVRYDVMPARRYDQIGLLEPESGMNRRLFRLCGNSDMYVDFFSIQYFMEQSVGLQLAVDMAQKVITLEWIE